MSDPSDFPTLLAFHRQARRLNQSRLAELVDVDHSYICRLESGKREPSRELVQRVCETFRLSATETDELMAAAGYASERGRAILASGDTDVLDAIEVLHDPAVPAGVRDLLRRTLRQVTALGRAAREQAA